MRIKALRKRVYGFLKSPETVLIGAFGSVILLGAIILYLPVSHQPERVSFVDALFTSTSAVCVTGLAVVDTGTDYTLFGQFVIVALVQAGGLGVMTFAALAFQISGRRLSLRSTALVHDSFFQKDFAAQFKNTFRTILLLTFIIEGFGIISLFACLAPSMNPADALFSAFFHSISAFCNAGFSIRSDNLIGIRDNWLVLVIIMALIVLGGLGYLVLHEILKSFRSKPAANAPLREKRFTLHTRLVLRATIILIIGGTIFLILFGLTPNETSVWDYLLNAAFQSVTARTAGFNSVDIGKLPASSLLILMILMFIGGSPGSCAGGIKTTTTALWLAKAKAALTGRKDIEILGRRIDRELMDRTELVVGLAIFWNLAGSLILLNSEAGLPVNSFDLIFEQISAFGTVGLSTGLTPNLSTVGKLWISATMFAGRLGPLTVVLWVVPRNNVNVHYPKGTVMIG